MTDRVRHILTVPNSTAHLAAIREIVNEVVMRSEYPLKKDASVIMLAVDEAMANIMKHAYCDDDGGGELSIEIELEASCDRFQVVLRDHGQPFEPSYVPVPNLKQHVQAGRKHGLGMYLMRSIMDEVSYTFVEGGWNELRMVKLAPTQ